VGEREILAGRYAGACLPEAFWKEPVWRRLGDFCSRWLEPGSTLERRVRGQIGRRVGLECYCLPRPTPPHNPHWEPLLVWLENKGVCAVEKRNALAAYRGHLDERSARDRWPGVLLGLSRRQPSRFVSTVSWGLHHVKLVLQPGEAVRAKGYLYFQHLWLDAAPRRRLSLRHQREPENLPRQDSVG